MDNQDEGRAFQTASMEHGVRGAKFNLIKSASLPGVSDMNMLCWDFSGGDFVLESTVGWAGRDPDMIGGSWRVRKSV